MLVAHRFGHAGAQYLDRWLPPHLGAPAEVARIQDLIRNNVAEQQAAAEAGQFGDDPQTFRVLRGKRILGAAAFLEDIETPFITLSVCVASIPIDKLFQTIYESEGAARSGKHVDPDGRPRVGLLQAMVSGTGILYKTHSRLAAPLFATDSPLTALLPIATERGVSRSRGVRTARAIVLRLSASFDFHFLGTFWHQQYKLLEILADSELMRPTGSIASCTQNASRDAPSARGCFWAVCAIASTNLRSYRRQKWLPL